MSTDILFKRDKILEESLITLANSELSKNLIFQGGGALHFIYSSPRYSGDVDFVDPTITQDVEQYQKNILEIGKNYEINSAKIMSSGKGVRAKWGHIEGDPVSKVEIESRDAGEYSKSSSKFNLNVKTPKDIYTDKIFANIARYTARKDSGQFPFKPNDFYDLMYITEQLKQQPSSKEDILKRAKAFDSEHIVNAENIDAMINMITDENNHDFFRKCISKSMMNDVYKLLNFDKHYFNKAAEHFEQYK